MDKHEMTSMVACSTPAHHHSHHPPPFQTNPNSTPHREKPRDVVDGGQELDGGGVAVQEGQYTLLQLQDATLLQHVHRGRAHLLCLAVGGAGGRVQRGVDVDIGWIGRQQEVNRAMICNA